VKIIQQKDNDTTMDIQAHIFKYANSGNIVLMAFGWDHTKNV
jgi:hypothetical protein